IVLFLGGIGISTGAVNAFGVFAGAALALLLAYVVFRSIVKLDVKLFFQVTGALLILLAAGLLSQGVHELQEASVLPTIIEHVYDINPPMNSDGTYPPLHEKGALGAVAKGVVGYDGNPSLLQIVSYVGYVVLAYLALFHANGRRARKQKT
ncbi:MAG: FTR1 family protein, partial [Candidatus Burarchaeum sp.]